MQSSLIAPNGRVGHVLLPPLFFAGSHPTSPKLSNTVAVLLSTCTAIHVYSYPRVQLSACTAVHVYEGSQIAPDSRHGMAWHGLLLRDLRVQVN